MVLGFLSHRAAQNAAAKSSQLQIQALALAESGMEDALIKLNKRSDFPPLSDVTQPAFVYSEVLFDKNGDEAGEYVVSIDTSQASSPPFWFITIASTGRVGPRGSPIAEKKIVGQIDTSKFMRNGTSKSQLKQVNPDFYRFNYVKGES